MSTLIQPLLVYSLTSEFSIWNVGRPSRPVLSILPLNFVKKVTRRWFPDDYTPAMNSESIFVMDWTINFIKIGSEVEKLCRFQGWLSGMNNMQIPWRCGPPLHNLRPTNTLVHDTYRIDRLWIMIIFEKIWFQDFYFPEHQNLGSVAS